MTGECSFPPSFVPPPASPADPQPFKCGTPTHHLASPSHTCPRSPSCIPSHHPGRTLRLPQRLLSHQPQRPARGAPCRPWRSSCAHVLSHPHADAGAEREDDAPANDDVRSVASQGLDDFPGVMGDGQAHPGPRAKRIYGVDPRRPCRSTHAHREATAFNAWPQEPQSGRFPAINAQC